MRYVRFNLELDKQTTLSCYHRINIIRNICGRCECIRITLSNRQYLVLRNIPSMIIIMYYYCYYNYFNVMKEVFCSEFSCFLLSWPKVGVARLNPKLSLKMNWFYVYNKLLRLSLFIFRSLGPNVSCIHF